ARNPIAHGHEEFISDDDKKIIDVYCKKINDLLTDININSIKCPELTEREIIEHSYRYKIYTEDDLLNTNEGSFNDTLYFIGSEIGAKKNLKGELSTGERGAIKASYFENEGRRASEFKGIKIPVRIVDQNPQKNGYILEPLVSLDKLYNNY
ncbi:MAG: hypothetical protein K6F77_09675, partial [Lachnospiraceae bacterium]|nr:hypothetical protein [Lachnospiraceae bacterium]